jgi:large subunit ribosomal protein L6
MSRVGKKPVPIPAGVQVNIQGCSVKVKGPLGELQVALPAAIKAEKKGDAIVLTADLAVGENIPALYGMTRARLANIVSGVCREFAKNLEIHGLGYKATLEGEHKLVFNIGRSHPVPFDLPKGIKAEVDKKATKIEIKGIDKDLVGQTVARIRALRPPEPYKGTGIRLAGERIIRKAGKTAAGVGAGPAAGPAKK